ncbi:hypothetical protein LCM20_16520 [Halobacillus litoralis]|uniref:hypothetical protein n=1 Tax=Halobacillus litoralis TaxID=45668 RepID=UPI001CD267C5|nr:hypothetical protein [Halobacillus litoralis]MCA0972214.1 hypothetical protein [Halobacillus litoralis]
MSNGLAKGRWRCEPREWEWKDGALSFRTEAETDYWQKTHYGFLVMERQEVQFEFLSIEPLSRDPEEAYV